MKDKYLYLILGALIIGNVILTYRNMQILNIPNEVGKWERRYAKLLEHQILGTKSDEELKEYLDFLESEYER